MTSYLPAHCRTLRAIGKRPRNGARGRRICNRHSGEEKCVSAATTAPRLHARSRRGRRGGRCRSDRAAAMGEGRASTGRFDGDLRRSRREPHHRRQRALPAIARPHPAPFVANPTSPPHPAESRPNVSLIATPKPPERCPRVRRSARGCCKPLPRVAMIRSPNSSDRPVGSSSRVHRGATRSLRVWLWPDQAVRHSRRADQRGDREIRERPQTAGDRTALRSPPERTCRHDRSSDRISHRSRSGLRFSGKIMRESKAPVCGYAIPGRVILGRHRMSRTMRLKTALWVAAYLRRCHVEGIFAVVRRRGAEEAGAVFVRISRLDGTSDLFGPAPQSAFDAAARSGARVSRRASPPSRRRMRTSRPISRGS